MKFLLLVFLFLTLNSQAQTISGKIIDKENNPLEYASVRLFNVSDSTVNTGIYSGENGSFFLESIERGNYFLVVTYANFTPDTTDIIVKNTGIKLGEIVLSLSKVLELEGVVAVGNLDVLKAGIDKRVYDVDKDVSTRGGTINDVLKNIPSVDVDQDGNISLRGDGNVTILLDGRPSGLVLGDGQNLLGALPANSIERIEVVTNPSAKYDPDGTAGIINVVMKKNKLSGFNGLISATVGTGNMLEGNFALSYRNKSLNSYINYSYNYREGFRNYSSELNRDVSVDSSITLNQYRDGGHDRARNTVVLGSDFFISENNVIGISGTISLGDERRTGDLENTLYGNGLIEDRWDRNSIDSEATQNFDLGANYKRDFKSDKGSWTTSIGHSIGNEVNLGKYEEVYFDANEEPTGAANLNQRLDNSQRNTITTAQTDFEFLLKDKSMRIETGAKMILDNQDISTFSETRDTISGAYFEDTVANFDFTYFGSVYSLYGIMGQELGKFKYQVGLRGEYAQQVPRLISSGEDFSTDYLNLFPSVHLRYEPKKDNEFSLSYSRRINRPRSRQLNPFTNYSDPFNLRSGNPELRPEFIHSFDASYALNKKKVTMTNSIFFRQTTGVINRVKYFRDDNTAIVTYDNIDESQSTGIEIIFLYRPTNWIKNSLTINGNYINYTNNSPLTDWNNSGYNYSATYIGTVDFWKKTASFQVNANYRSPRIRPQGVIQPRGSIDLSVEKRFFDKKLAVSFRVTDIFNTRSFRLNLSQEGTNQIGEYKWLTRRFILNVSYKFGNLEMKMPKSNGGGGGMD